jgi:hypothetical protein
MSVTYTAALPIRDHTVVFLSGLLHAERQRLGTRTATRALGCFMQATLVLRWLLEGTKVKQLAGDNAISLSTGYAYLHEGITILAAHAPGLPAVLLAAKMAGYPHVNIDGTLIETDRAPITGHACLADVIGRHRWSGGSRVQLHGWSLGVVAGGVGLPVAACFGPDLGDVFVVVAEGVGDDGCRGLQDELAQCGHAGGLGGMPSWWMSGSSVLGCNGWPAL